MLPQNVKERVWKDIKEPLLSLKNKRSLEQIEYELWKDIDKGKFERLSMRFVKHIQWLGSIRNSDPAKMVLDGFPELWNWYSEYLLKYNSLSKEQAEAL